MSMVPHGLGWGMPEGTAIGVPAHNDDRRRIGVGRRHDRYMSLGGRRLNIFRHAQDWV